MSSSAGDAGVAFGEAPVIAKVGSAHASLEDIVAEARAIWRAVGASKVDKGDAPGNDALLERLQTEHANFCQSFPIVLRWMVQLREFHPKAFEKYLRKHASAELGSREDFLRLQAEYLVLLHREANPRQSEKFIRFYREQLVNQLLAEDKAFVEIQKQVEADFEAQAEATVADRRRRLYEYLLAQKARAGAPPGGGAAAV